MKKSLGQFFTTNHKIQKVFQNLLLNDKGVILEPSVGEGDLLSQLKTNGRIILTVEYDNKLKKIKQPLNSQVISKKGCFFEQTFDEKIFSIVSNPPYVGKNEYMDFMSESMKNFIDINGYNGKYNIAYLFIHKCAELLEQDGEMIFIVPKDFSYSTSAQPLRNYLMKHGRFSHWIDCQEEKVFSDASIETLVIFRWVKNLDHDYTKTYFNLDNYFNQIFENKIEFYIGKQKTLFFMNGDDHKIFKNFISFSDLFEVYVGSVSGCDPVFKVNESLFDYKKNKKALKYFNTGLNKLSLFIDTTSFNKFSDMPIDIQKYLLKNKTQLLKRYGISQDNWWKWSFLRNAKLSLKETDNPRIYTLSKTRSLEPFILGNNNGFVGSVYGIFPKHNSIDLQEVLDILNSPLYKQLYLSSGLAVGNKFQSTPNALKDLPFPPINQIKHYANLLRKK